ncbi:outer membrane beta-barrel protein [Mangrovimonas sp. AS39]|uniref:outer membrane beta-barrel protein n=1 Tax=Mangrovimonas futianensis TaxID=2895523 RepID=UPI001E3286F7|nr:outer membrane beta-barrel protein [Mangrovimonas futianensis]MCF1192522.1 outer membrane beta-barrel protein [Mangrovimonas futianensis]MCF1196148.1 outer membrane beta-barrel protein [Mangrovimonas futianensis]
MKKFLVFMACFYALTSIAQTNPFKISGKLVAEEDQSPLESATVYLQRVKDSSLITYTISDKDGRFSLQEKTGDTEANLFVSYVGYKTYYQNIKLDKEVIDLKNIVMAVSSDALDEVVIKASAPVTIKKDTLEFNVKSFKTKKDATVEDLLKQLPGVTVEDDGTIKVNGKSVNKILVNGKPFFGNDPSITTKNLTKDIIEKIQVVDTKSKSEAFTGEVTDGENKTINLTIKEENNKGVFGRVSAGGGTDERYEFAGMFNYFDNDRRISVLAGGNNINSPGFSFGEIEKMFGRGNSMSWNSNGSFTIDGRTFGGGQGITTSQNAGMNYADVIGKDTDVSADYFFSGSSSFNESTTQRENILPDSRYYTDSRSRSDNDTDSHSANLEFDIKVDSTFLINVQPSFRYSRTKTSFDNGESSFNDQRQLTNTSATNSFVERDGKTFNNRINITKKFDKGGYLRVGITNEIGQSNSDDFLNSETYVYGADELDPNNPDFILIDETIRNQFTDGNGETDNLGSEIRYSIPIVEKKFFVNLEYKFNRNKSTDVKSTYDLDDMGEYSQFNEDLSTDFEYLDQNSTPGLSLSYRGEKFSARAGAEYIFRTLENRDNLRPQFNIERDFEAVQLYSNANYRFSGKSSMYMGYRLNNDPPELFQLQAFTNVSDPLNTIVGNPNLEPSNNHRLYMGFNNYDFQKHTGFWSYVNARVTDNAVVSKTIIDENFVRETTYENVDGNYQIYAGMDYNKEVKIDSLRTVRFGVGANGNFSRNVNFNNGVQYASDVRSLSPEVNFKFTWKDVFEIRPRYSLTFTNNSYDLEEFEDQRFQYHNLNIRTGFFLPKNLEWRNDITFNYNPNISAGFQKSAWFWNTTVAYSFLQDKATATFKVYDLLNQNTNARRTATQNYIQDSQSTVLQQYFMLSFSWKFNSLGKKGEVNDRGGFWMD